MSVIVTVNNYQDLMQLAPVGSAGVRLLSDCGIAPLVCRFSVLTTSVLLSTLFSTLIAMCNPGKCVSTSLCWASTHLL